MFLHHHRLLLLKVQMEQDLQILHRHLQLLQYKKLHYSQVLLQFEKHKMFLVQ